MSRGEPDEETNQRLSELRKLDEAFEHIVWADEDTKAEPFWDDHMSVPQFVRDLIADVIEDSVWGSFETMPDAARDTLVDIFEKNLVEQGGWSLSGIAEDLHYAFNVPIDDAELVARTESAKVLNDAREEGYQRIGAEESLFRWTGPHDHRSTDACQWMKEVTHTGAGPMVAEYGRPASVSTLGEPVTLGELVELEREASELFFPRLEFRRHVLHPNERHTFVESFKAKYPLFGAGDPRGAVEVDHKLDLSPAAGGTFVAA